MFDLIVFLAYLGIVFVPVIVAVGYFSDDH
jgi:hypothetical protein